ncbi:MAG: AAA family ATPase [Saprospiraceae bacterium]|nr:AAA family ATPase [Saprospiraceae bacterium]
MKLLIFGASGSGTTTLGMELGKRIQYIHLDADDYYWKQTDPPYQEKRPVADRIKHLTADAAKYQHVILSGSLVSWGPYWHTAFSLAVFLYLPLSTRMARLEKRESERNKDRPNTGVTESRTREFMDYVRQYDDPDFTGRSLAVHNQWIKLLNCPVLRIEGEIPLNERIDLVLYEIRRLNIPLKGLKA